MKHRINHQERAARAEAIAERLAAAVAKLLLPPAAFSYDQRAIDAARDEAAAAAGAWAEHVADYSTLAASGSSPGGGRPDFHSPSEQG